jgi:hypothetical protein
MPRELFGNEMQNNKICVVIAGIENLKGDDALHLKEYFKVERYPNQRVGTNYYYMLFDNDLNQREGRVGPEGKFSEFLVFLGLRYYAFRFDTARIPGDTAVDYVMKLTPKMPSYLDRMPEFKRN